MYKILYFHVGTITHLHYKIYTNKFPQIKRKYYYDFQHSVNKSQVKDLYRKMSILLAGTLDIDKTHLDTAIYV